ncbi:MAG: LysM peptidoglycan-binding domain-containing protein [Bacteroidetes bacterium]|nr:LysM peptidoglycan-binding domain-containing protein [Bacteroidota bacterium]
MKGIIAAILFLGAFPAAAQTEQDSIEHPLPVDSLEVKDSVKSELISFSDFDFAPADDSPELVADRLSCLERTIPLTYNNKVHAFIEYFTVRDREYTRSMLRKKDLYFPLFEKKLKEYNLPDELKYLSIIESGLNPRASSVARAVGLWQFMSGTGRYFGLQNNWLLDERMDPEQATDAACRYLSQLHSIFKDWHLALAAYNSGPGTVRWAIRRSGYKKTFWEIYNKLPRETRSYVPQFIAIIYALNFAEEHNLYEPAHEEFLPHDTLNVNTFFHFETFAKLTGACLEDLQLLNPSIRKNVVPEDDQTHIIKIPKGIKESFALNRSEILDSVATGKKEWEVIAQKISNNTYGRERNVYHVRYGDVLGTIAQRFGVSVRDLKEWNHLHSSLIRTGQRLVIWLAPTASVSQISEPMVLPVSEDNKTYVVQPGDTLWDISKKLPGITIERIKALNNLKSSKLKPGQKLIVG